VVPSLESDLVEMLMIDVFS